MTQPLAFLYGRLGPYHVARIAATAALHPSIAIEFFRDSAEYAWDEIGAPGFARHRVVPDGDGSDLSRWLFARRLFRLLEDTRPGVLALPGWHHYGSLLALGWARRRGVPTVIMSASQASDAVRQPWKEALKRRVVGMFDAALVGGQNQRDYILSLGMDKARVFEGCDVVDNDHFAQAADRVRGAGPRRRIELALPARYFLATSRFVEKKNLPFLLHAYAHYVRHAPDRAVDLVLLGDGPLRGQLLRLRDALALQERVHFLGFKQYDELPEYYALAEALVHPSQVEQWGLVVNEAMAAGLPVLVSRHCGCVPDLVHEGENGYAFSPNDVEALGTLLLRVASDEQLRARLGRRSSELIAQHSATTFAVQMEAACRVATEVVRGGRAPMSAADWALLIAMSLA